MDEQDARWIERLIEEGLIKVVEPQVATCTCHIEVINGERCYIIGPSCVKHGIRSRHIPQPGATLKARRVDAHRHSAHSVKGDS